MGFPDPVPALVIRYSFLWSREYDRGQEEGVKDRPCAIVLVAADQDGDTIVTVLPVTHSPPSDPALAVALPHLTKERLGLDAQRSWVLLTEANRFRWPGPDLRMGEAGRPETVAYGLLPRTLFKQITSRFADAMQSQSSRVIRRTQ